MTISRRKGTAALFGLMLSAVILAAPGRLPAADGVLDPFFDGNGGNKFGYSPGTSIEIGYGVALQPSGRIVLVGSTTASDPAYGGAEMNVFGIRRDGGLDTAFGFGGARRLGTANNDSAQSVATLGNGKIVVAGTTTGLVGDDFLVCRLKADGSVDRTFGVNGCRRILVANAYQPQIAIRPDGKIIVAGSSGLNEDFTVIRLTRGGKIDRTFSGDGIATYDLGDTDRVLALALQKDGKILLAGYTYNVATSNDFAVVRIRPGGTLDASFGGDGIVTVDVFGGSDIASAIAVQPDGKIVVAGESFVPGYDFDMGIVRLDRAGNLDPGFNGNGKRLVHFGGTRDDSASAVVVLRDGRIVLGGGTEGPGVDDDFALAWLSPGGNLDPSVGVGGLVITDVEGTNGSDNSSAMVFQRDGKLVLAGSTSDFNGDVAAARYLVDLPWNGGFERAFAAVGRADVWKLRRTLAADGRDGSTSHAGAFSMKISARRPNRAVKRVEQWTGANGKKNDEFAVSAWTLADGATGPGAFEVRITFKHTDNTSRTIRMRPAAGTHGWEESTRTIQATKPFRNMKVTLVYGKTAGTVWFDDVLVVPQQ